MPRRRPLGCQEVVELVTDFLEGALTPEVRARLEDHLRACRSCAAYLAQMRTMVRALGRLSAPAVDSGAREELVATLPAVDRGLTDRRGMSCIDPSLDQCSSSLTHGGTTVVHPHHRTDVAAEIAELRHPAVHS